jgi:hypothetical protein
MKRGHNMPIAQNVNKVLSEIARKMGGGVLRVGYLEGEKYADGTPVAYVAYLNEFGHGGRFPSPPRPTFRVMISKESPGWPATMAALAKQFNYEGMKSLSIMGKEIEGALQESVYTTTVAPLSKTSLVLRAKFWTNPQDITARDVVEAQKTAAADDGDVASGTQAKPLVWTHTMVDAVGSEVVRK